MRGCCLSGTFFYSYYNKKFVILEKDSINLEIKYIENCLHSMSNHYPCFPDISALITPMSMNYHECIIHRKTFIAELIWIIGNVRRRCLSVRCLQVGAFLAKLDLIS